MREMLLDDYPLLVLPSLAKKVGLNEAIVLQQLHYWIRNKSKTIDNHKWIYNTYDEWLVQFPFWSKSTMRRTVSNLEKMELIITANHNKMKADKTKWYTINYDRLLKMNSPDVQDEHSECSNWTDGSVQNEQSNTRDYSETKTETNYIYSLFSHWNEKKIIEHRKLNEKMKRHLNARLEDYSFNELKTAINNYYEVLTSDKYYWTHKWTLQDFMKPGNVERFLDEADPFENFLKNDQKQKGIPQYDPSKHLF